MSNSDQIFGTAVCFNCGNYYTDYGYAMTDAEATASVERAAQIKAWTSGYCSSECMEEDNQRLVTGNGIIAAAIANNPQAFSSQTHLQLQTNGIKLPQSAYKEFLSVEKASIEAEHVNLNHYLQEDWES